MRILGVDPGSRVTGYGCIEINGNRLRHVDHGLIRLVSSKDPSPSDAKRLLQLSTELNDLIQKLRPEVIAVEKVFFAKNALSALKLGQVRGVVLLSGSKNGLQIAEYAATEVKQALVGHGQAKKEQVAQLVKLLLGNLEFEKHDSSDALAIAICHAHQSLGGGQKIPKRSKKRVTIAQAVGHKIQKGSDQST